MSGCQVLPTANIKENKNFTQSVERERDRTLMYKNRWPAVLCRFAIE